VTEHTEDTEPAGYGEPVAHVDDIGHPGPSEVVTERTGPVEWPGQERYAGDAAPAGPDEPSEPEVATATTGHPAVDAALRTVSTAAGAPPADQVPAYQALHRTLRETLASIDQD